MTVEARVEDEVSPPTAGSGLNRKCRFEVTPLAGVAARTIGRRRDTHTVEVLVRNAGHFVQISIGGTRVVSIPRQNWRMWLAREGSKEPYVLAPLVMTHTTTGLIWLQITGHTSPIPVVQNTIDKLIWVCQD